VIEDGIIERSDFSRGFKYKLINFGGLKREAQYSELPLLFKTAAQKWKSRKKFISIFNVQGKLLKSIAELEPKSNVLVVGTSYTFHGFGGLFVTEKEILEAIGCTFIQKDTQEFTTCPRKKGQLVLEPESKEKSFLLKIRAKSNLAGKEKKTMKISRLDKYRYFNSIKEKLGETSVKLDKSLPKLHHSTLKKLMEKYELSESDLHKIYAQYKTLLIMSVAQHPSHDFKAGIRNSTLIECLRKGEAKEDGLMEKLIFNIDIDRKGFLTWEEFLKAMSVIQFGSLSMQIDMMFKMYDSDLSGTLSFQEIRELCQRQLQTSRDDSIAEYLAESFAGIIFSLACVPVTECLAAEELKRILSDKEQHSIIKMFCNFQN
jgi:Ca2+-binding EF-hand superfamily protein